MCLCGSGRPYETCCGRFHAGEPAPDAETLMRSRYSAYVLGLEDYLQATWHPDTRPATLELDATPRPQWLGLSVKSHSRWMTLMRRSNSSRATSSMAVRSGCTK